MKDSLVRLQQKLIDGSAQDRRRVRRTPVQGQVTLLWRGDLESIHEALLPVIENSAGGLSVRAQGRIAPDQPVSVVDGRRLCRGVVRHCSPDGEDFRIGIELLSTEDLPPAYADRFALSDVELPIAR